IRDRGLSGGRDIPEARSAELSKTGIVDKRRISRSRAVLEERAAPACDANSSRSTCFIGKDAIAGTRSIVEYYITATCFGVRAAVVGKTATTCRSTAK